MDVSKGRLEVCVRRGRQAREGEHAFGVSNDPAGIETLLARLLAERPALVILEATGCFERPVAAAFGWWWADPLGALAMLPVILWQGWETLEEAREDEDEEDAE